MRARLPCADGLTLSPRQRIVAWRDIQEKQRQGIDTSELKARYQYHGVETAPPLVYVHSVAPSVLTLVI